MNSGGDGSLLIAISASLVQEFLAGGSGILYSLFSAESNRLPVLWTASSVDAVRIEDVATLANIQDTGCLEIVVAIGYRKIIVSQCKIDNTVISNFLNTFHYIKNISGSTTVIVFLQRLHFQLYFSTTLRWVRRYPICIEIYTCVFFKSLSFADGRLSRKSIFCYELPIGRWVHNLFFPRTGPRYLPPLLFPPFAASLLWEKRKKTWKLRREFDFERRSSRGIRNTRNCKDTARFKWSCRN